MTVLTAITGGNVGAAATGESDAFSLHANGDLETIATAVDSDFGEVTTNSDGNYADGYLLDNMPGDFGTMDDLSVQLRYGWSATPSNTTWPTLGARVVVESNGTILAGATAGGGYQTVASSITATTPTNSSVTGFTYVNTSASKADWDDANLQIVMVRDRSKGGGGQGQRVYAGDVTGNYSIAVGEDVLLADDVESASETGTPVIGQKHVILADDTESASETQLGVLGQKHVLLADDTESTSETSTPVVNEVVPLFADDTEATSEVTTPVIAQLHIILANDTESASETSAPVITQEQTLLVVHTESSSEVSIPVLVQKHILLNDSIQSLSEVTTPVLAEVNNVNNLLAEDAESTSEVSAPIMGQAHILLTPSVESTSELSLPILSEVVEVSDDITFLRGVVFSELNKVSDGFLL